MRGPVERFDHSVMLWLNSHASPWLDRRAVEVTALGEGYVVAVLVIVAAALLWLYGARVYAATLAAASLGAAVFTPILKNTFERPRPALFEVRGYLEETSYAYPSGHALLATATLFTLAYVVHRLAGRRAATVAAASLAGLAIALTGWSRLHLNVHHPSDVIAGFAIGLTWALLCCAWAERTRERIGETIRRGDALIEPLELMDRNRMTRPAFALSIVLAVIGACGVRLPAVAQQLPPASAAVPAAQACTVVRAATPLPDDVRETSGLARGAHGFWTHNDAGNDPIIFRIDHAGRIAQGVTIRGARLEDWEDIEAAPCGAGTCLYIGDIGDNDAERRHVTVYRVREPAADASAATAEPLNLTYPDGARDAEALFVDSAGTLHVVTKGRNEDIALYRVPADAWQRGSVTLERVRVLFPQPSDSDDRVTAATMTPDGRWVGVRSYRTLYLYPTRELSGTGAVTPVAYDLAALGEAQGESLVIANDGMVWMTSEAESRRATPSWLQLNCPLE